jgi:hypothetical protein
MKSSLIGGSIALLVVASFIGYFIHRDIKLKDKVEHSSKKYAYYVTSEITYPAYLGDGDECLSEIRKYYKAIEKDKGVQSPNCASMWLPVNSIVYPMGEKKGDFVEIAYVKRRSYGRDKIIVGYVLESTLHDETSKSRRP